MLRQRRPELEVVNYVKLSVEVRNEVLGTEEQAKAMLGTMESLVRRILWVSSVIVLLTASSMAPAQVTVDVSKITCDELVKYEIADPKLIAIWISGYYQGLRKNPIVDKHQTLQSIDKLEEYCFKHPNDLVMNEVGELLGAR